ncbi:MAG: NADH-quinone oxidoreductase subunit M, partial [Candidatus Nanopelagicales bacterium]
MNAFPWLTTLGLIPLVGALVVMLLPKGRPALAKQVALVFSLATLVLLIVMALQFDATSGDPFQFVERYDWIPAFGISYAVGVDGIGLVLIALAAVLVPIVML